MNAMSRGCRQKPSKCCSKALACRPFAPVLVHPSVQACPFLLPQAACLSRSVQIDSPEVRCWAISRQTFYPWQAMANGLDEPLAWLELVDLDAHPEAEVKRSVLIARQLVLTQGHACAELLGGIIAGLVACPLYGDHAPWLDKLMPWGHHAIARESMQSGRHPEGNLMGADHLTSIVKDDSAHGPQIKPMAPV